MVRKPTHERLHTAVGWGLYCRHGAGDVREQGLEKRRSVPEQRAAVSVLQAQPLPSASDVYGLFPDPPCEPCLMSILRLATGDPELARPVALETTR